jgi:hypothetical protein
VYESDIDHLDPQWMSHRYTSSGPRVLSGLGVGRLFISGAQTDACVRSTLHGAFTRGYDVTLVSDAHTTEDRSQDGAPPPAQVIAHTNLYWNYHTAPGRTAGTVETNDVDFSGTS